MAWAALAVPIVTSILGSMSKKDDAKPAGPQLPAPPSLGEIFASNAKLGGQPTQFSTPQTNPFSSIPVGGSSRGSNG